MGRKPITTVSVPLGTGVKTIKDRTLVSRFALSSLAVFLVAAGVLSWVVTTEIRANKEAAAEFHAEFISRVILAPNLEKVDFDSELALEEAERSRAIAFEHMLEFPVLRVLVLDRGGRIIFASEDGHMGDLSADEGSTDIALAGSTVSRAVRDPFGSDLKLLITGVPIVRDGVTLAVVEIHQDYQAIQSAANSLFVTVVSTMLAGLAILYLLLLPIARKASQALHDRNRDLKLSEGRFRSLVQNSSDVVSVLDPEGRVTYITPSVAKVFGHRPIELEGHPFTDLIHPDDHSKVYAVLAETLSRSGTSSTVDCRWRADDGTWREGESVFTNLISDPSVSGIVVNTRDVTAKVSFQRQLATQAFEDSLTGLANRALFKDRVEHTLVLRERDQETVATLFLDIDDFKSVNDAYGHSVGDELLRQVAVRLKACLRPGDTAARFSGDEFALLLEDADKDEAALVATRVIETLSEPFIIGDREIRAAASVGVVVFHGGADVEDLLRNADLAMYAAKREGKNRFRIFEPAMHDKVVERLQLVADLRKAIDNEDFHVEYQPLLTLEDQSLVGVEALARWKHPIRGDVPPAVFIPLAEETGLIAPLGRLILRMAISQGSEWVARMGTDFSVSVNLSARQLLEPGLVAYVEELLWSNQMEASALLLEVTESQIMEDVAVSISRLNAFKSIGIRIAVDDFGKGQTALSQLGRLPLDVLKIDRSFVAALGLGGEELAVVKAIIKISQSYNYLSIAEGIEEPEQLSELIRLGADVGQGYLFSRPVSPEAIEKRYISVVSQAV
jgi:diguanylate cyclase (GGDEF)-like protein/PAS domain S-box-containing protein